MKRLLLPLLPLLVIACSSGQGGGDARILQPSVELVQIVGPAELNYPSGSFEVQYGVRIANRSAEPITLRQIVLDPVGDGGPYRINRERYFFNEEFAGNGAREISFWARARATGSAHSIDATAPVLVRATAHFESPAGNFRKVVTANFTQYGQRGRRRN